MEEKRLTSSGYDVGETKNSINNRRVKYEITKIDDGVKSEQITKVTKVLVKSYDSYSCKKSFNQYIILGEIGRGQFGKVKLCCDERGRKCAVKICRKPRRTAFSLFLKRTYDALYNEVNVLKRLSHPNIVRLYEVIDSQDYPKVYMVMEYLSGGPIKYRDEEGNPLLSKEDAHYYFVNLMSGLRYLHDRGVIHRDIKPENLMISSSGVLKIIDFNSVQMENDRLVVTAGTPAFFAPELCVEDKVGPVTKAVDIWAAGVCLYMFTFGNLPFDVVQTEIFDAGSLAELQRRIVNNQLLFMWKIDGSLKNILHKMLTKNPKLRPTVEEIQQDNYVTQKRMNQDDVYGVSASKVLRFAQSSVIVNYISINVNIIFNALYSVVNWYITSPVSRLWNRFLR